MNSPFLFGDQLFAGRSAPMQDGTPVMPNNLPIAGFEQSGPVGGEAVAPIFDPHHYARFNGEQLYTLTASSSLLILPRSSTLRNMLMMRNTHATADIYVSFGTDASVNSVLLLAAGQTVLFDVVVIQDDVFAFSTTASATISIASSTTPGRST